jgi:hypothetical protein
VLHDEKIVNSLCLDICVCLSVCLFVFVSVYLSLGIQFINCVFVYVCLCQMDQRPNAKL